MGTRRARPAYPSGDAARQSRRWLADVGLGGRGPSARIPLEPGRIERQAVGDFRLRRDERLGHVLERRVGDDWRDLYAFADELTAEMDVEGANHVAATWPGSPFVEDVKCARHERDGRVVLLEGPRLIERCGDTTKRTALADHRAIVDVLRVRFGIAIDDDLERCLGARLPR